MSGPSGHHAELYEVEDPETFETVYTGFFVADVYDADGEPLASSEPHRLDECVAWASARARFLAISVNGVRYGVGETSAGDLPLLPWRSSDLARRFAFQTPGQTAGAWIVSVRAVGDAPLDVSSAAAALEDAGSIGISMGSMSEDGSELRLVVTESADSPAERVRDWAARAPLLPRDAPADGDFWMSYSVEVLGPAD